MVHPVVTPYGTPVVYTPSVHPWYIHPLYTLGIHSFVHPGYTPLGTPWVYQPPYVLGYTSLPMYPGYTSQPPKGVRVVMPLRAELLRLPRDNLSKIG